jgi:hypothetical protein
VYRALNQRARYWRLHQHPLHVLTAPQMTDWEPTPSKQMILNSIRMRRCFCRSLCHQLRKHHAAHLEVECKGGSYLIRGSKAVLEEPSISVDLEIKIKRDWMFRPPLAQSRSHFIRRDGNWHHYTDDNGIRGLCYVHPIEWFDVHKTWCDRRLSPYNIAKRTSNWLLLAFDDLVHKHYLGWQAGLEDWPQEWKDWKHNQEGIDQYFYETRRKPKGRN